MNTNPPAPNVVTEREVYQLVDKLRIELTAAIEHLGDKFDAAMTTHQAEHRSHDDLHDRERDKRHDEAERAHDRRASLTRWAVTTILSGVGVLVALVAALTDVL